MIESIAYGVIMILVVRGLVGLLDDLGVFKDEEEAEDEWSD